jgi:glucose-6-phosphate isomerase
VLSAVGIFPLAFAGANTDGLLNGARGYHESLLLRDAADNDALRLALLHYLLHTRGGMSMCVQYTYGDPLVLLGDWFRQLWAESLAKGKQLDGGLGLGCMTPVSARGSTDQHSQNQLFMEGPDDKLYGFISAGEWAADPVLNMHPDDLPPQLAYLGGQSFGAILDACRGGTRDALIEAGRPVYEISLARVTALQVGAYLQLWMLTTAYAGLIYNVNPFDQPGVERSKLITRALMTG